MKELNQEDFSMKLVKDLGMKLIGGVRSDTGQPRQARFVIVQCACGEQNETRADIAKKAKTCRVCSARAAGLTHGDSHSRLYKLWQQIRQRHTKKHYTDIKVCKEWRDYLTFKAWALANGYKDNLTIDRRDNKGNYEPSNCRWTTQVVQGRNTRKLFAHNKSGYRGVSYDKNRGKWYTSIKIVNKSKFLGRYSTALLAAKAYDTYVVTNNLEHTINGVLYEPIPNT